MADKASGYLGAGEAVTDPELIRNVVLVGPTGSGKTTLIEQLLVAAGALDRAGAIDLGSTVCDFDDFEILQQKSSSLAIAPLTYRGLKINLIDTPGFSEFAGELRAGLRAADAALFVISALAGVDQATTMLWDECASVDMPRAVVVTHLDKRKGDFDDIVAICQRVFGEDVVPLHLPLLADNYAVAGLIDLLTQKIHDYSSGARVVRDSDIEHGPLIETARNSLLEAVIAQSEDETLMDRYIDDDDIDVDDLIIDLEQAMARGHFYPVVASAISPVGFGAEALLDVIARGFPAPTEHPLPYVATPEGDPVDLLDCTAGGPLCAEVIKTTTDPYLGRLSLVRIFSGSLTAGQTVHVSGHFTGNNAHQDHDVDERIGSINVPVGKALFPVDVATAGDIVALTKLIKAETGDTLSSPNNPLLIEQWLVPEPLVPVAIVAQTKTDDDKLTSSLARLVAEDPTLRLELNDETGQIVLWCMGETHIALVLHRLATRYGVTVGAEPVRVSLRETFATAAHGHGRLAKQSGGHGQFAVCEIEVEPMPLGSGFEFVDRVVGGAIPHNYIPSVEMGIRQQMQRGVAAGYPVVDIRVSLVGGKSHPVDSSDLAFHLAGELALKDAAAAAGMSLLEPVDAVLVITSDEYLGAVMTDVTSRRGRILGTAPLPGSQTEISAIIPQMELTRYSIDLRSMTHGTASFERNFSAYEVMPRSVAQRVQAAGRNSS